MRNYLLKFRRKGTANVWDDHAVRAECLQDAIDSTVFLHTHLRRCDIELASERRVEVCEVEVRTPSAAFQRVKLEALKAGERAEAYRESAIRLSDHIRNNIWREGMFHANRERDALARELRAEKAIIPAVGKAYTDLKDRFDALQRRCSKLLERSRKSEELSEHREALAEATWDMLTKAHNRANEADESTKMWRSVAAQAPLPALDREFKTYAIKEAP